LRPLAARNHRSPSVQRRRFSAALSTPPRRGTPNQPGRRRRRWG